MNLRATIAVLLGLALTAVASHGVELGDSRDRVLSELGQPSAEARRADGVEIWTFPTGEIRLRNAQVCYVMLNDATEIAARAVSGPERSAQLRIAELEARLAAMRVRLARAEAEARSRVTMYHRTASHSPARDVSAAPQPWRDPAAPQPATSDAAIFASAGSGL